MGPVVRASDHRPRRKVSPDKKVRFCEGVCYLPNKANEAHRCLTLLRTQVTASA
jgi:hypothetical protein